MGARLFQDIDEEVRELENLDADMIMAKQVEQLDKERKELQSRLKSQEKKVDYMERAKRLEEIPLLIKDHEEFEIKDKENWEQQEEERIKECIAEREIALQTSERLNRIKADKDVFLSKLKSDRGADFRTKCEEFNKLLEVERAKRMAERREKRRRERKMKYQREKEEEEQLRHDEQLKNESVYIEVFADPFAYLYLSLEEGIVSKQFAPKKKTNHVVPRKKLLFCLFLEREEEERAATARKEKMDEEYRKQKEKLDEIEAKQKAREKMIEMKLQRETEETTERPSRTAMAKDFRKEAADVPVKNDDTDGPRRNLDDDKVWRRSGRGGDDDVSREDSTAAKKTDEGGSWRKPGSNEAWNKRGNDDRGSTEDRKTQDPREDRGPRDERWSRDPRDDRGPRDDRVGRDDRWSREPRDARSSRDDRWSRDPRDDRGPRDDRVPKDDRGPREDRWSRDPREDRGPRDDRWSRDSRDDRAPREDRWSRDPRDDRGPREDRWSRDSRDDRGPRGGGGSWSRGGEDRGGDSWRSKATEDRWNKGPDDRKRDTRDGGDNWRSKGSDERSFGNDKEFRREDDNLTNKRRVPADKDGFPADRMPAGGRRAPPPRGKDCPTLLFEQYSIGSQQISRRFYACSACRDRKDCNFFFWGDDYDAIKKSQECAKPILKEHDWQNRLLQIQNYDASEIKFCHTCDILLLKEEWQGHEESHKIAESVNLIHPSNFLSMFESNKKEAQYLFKDSSLKFLEQLVRKMGFTHILCLGAPTVHEKFLQNNNVNSLLLDIDKRFVIMIHICYFLLHTVEAITLDAKRFGIEAKDSNFLPTMLFFPYFHEKMVHEHFQSFQMSDYQVEYRNHKKFQNGPQGRKHGSPIRIFTNISLSCIELPIEDGYKMVEHMYTVIDVKDVSNLLGNIVIESDIGEVEEEETGATRVQLYHKEEAKARIQADAKDRAGLRLKLDSCIDPMDSKEHPEGSIVNIVSGKLAPASVNVENAVMIGETMLEDYEKTWPEGFNSTISKKVETMAASCKSVKIGDSKVYDLNEIYSRVIALLSSDRDVDVNDVFFL
ncbi:Zinc finger CCHC domain-containing protein 4 [Nymphon striatum]|nr:Zinc finger CCHC domain-containing protein 4 [Nymphon striatum]